MKTTVEVEYVSPTLVKQIDSFMKKEVEALEERSMAEAGQESSWREANPEVAAKLASQIQEAAAIREELGFSTTADSYGNESTEQAEH